MDCCNRSRYSNTTLDKILEDAVNATDRDMSKSLYTQGQQIVSNDLPLFQRVIKPGIDNLFFIGLLQPLGAIMPLAEAQARWICAYLKGDSPLPSVPEMEKRMHRDREKMFKRYTKSKRHTMQVDFREYREGIKHEIKAGAKRAELSGHKLPVPPRAEDAEPVASSSTS